ncbi:AMP-binding protein [Nannocystis sp. SCPEA4]|uniref:AMP-binding protein n=1 Tax=Nannocystis sp. SCPEA4 TaxID=2996787 RepID=UPI00226E50ED|nr:AMP-binding protein [Nannocystis sp. SCPEA4]MCY1053537.1 AMP-binding protein [Nannocystis sp. SCPEA4]
MLDLGKLSCLGEALRDATITYKSRVALIEADRHRENSRHTFAELRAQAERFGAGLQVHGFGPGDRCAIVMQNQSKWLIGATGALWAGAVLVPIDYKLTAPEQHALLAHCRPRVVLAEWPAWDKLQREDPSIFERTLVIVTEAPDGANIGRALRWEDLPQGSGFTFHARAREDVACIVYSSGTGGAAKGCQLSHANYMAQAETLGNLYPLSEGDRYFSILPTNHAIDFMCGFLLALMMGGAVVHQRTLRPAYLASTMKRYGITHMALVPTILKTLEKKIKDKIAELPKWQRLVLDGLMDINEYATRQAPNHGLSKTLLAPIHEYFGGKLRLMFCGGAFVDRQSAEYFNRLGLPVVIGYGLTEAGTVLTVNDLKPFRGDSVGKAVEGTEIELRDVNESGVGEVWVRGPTVMLGYLDAPELTREAIVDGWLRTGDLGTMDAAGHLKLLGRTKNMIVTEGGKNVYPEDIEAAFGDIDDCEEFCVFAANFIWPTGKMTDEQLIVVVRPKAGLDEAARADVIDAFRKRNRQLADYKRISAYVLWEREFPRTASQKIKRDPLARELKPLGRALALREL